MCIRDICSGARVIIILSVDNRFVGFYIRLDELKFSK